MVHRHGPNRRRIGEELFSLPSRIPSDCVPPTLSDSDADIDYDELVLNPAPAPQLNQGAVQVDPHAVDPPVPVPQVNTPGTVVADLLTL